MAEVTISFDIRREPCRENINRELLWYDTIKKELLEFHGGELSFEYKEDDYLVAMGEQERKNRGITSTFRALPVVKDLSVTNYKKSTKKTNEKEIREWFKRYLNYNDSNIIIESSNVNEINFYVPEDEIDDFVYDAERNGFRVSS